MTNKTQLQEDRYLDLKGLASYSSLGVGTIRDYLKQGLPAFKIKGKVLIRKSEFADLGCIRIENQVSLKR